MLKKLLTSWVEAEMAKTLTRIERVREASDDMRQSDSWYLKGRLDAFSEMRDLLKSEDKL